MTADSHSSEDLARLYREVIKAHAADPVGYKRIIETTHRHEAYNPLCGDRATIFLELDGDRVKDASFVGRGCSISTASA